MMIEYCLNIFEYQINKNNFKINDNIIFFFCHFFHFLNFMDDTLMVNLFFNIIN